MNDFMWDIRQATRAQGNKILMINDSRMHKKVLEAADVVLNEEAGIITNPERGFWHCLRAMVVGHDAKTSYQFHHAKNDGITNDFRARLIMACAAALELGYCVFHSHREKIQSETA